MQPSTTRVPAVLAALVERVQVPGVENLYGPQAAQTLHGDVLLIGFGGDGNPAVHVDIERAEGLGNRLVEVTTVRCLFSTISGDIDMRARVERAGVFMAALDVALKADQGLGGVTDRVTLGPNADWVLAQTNDGAVCEVPFEIVTEALL